MKKSAKIALIGAAAASAATISAAEAIHFLLSSKNADISFLFKNEPAPDEYENALIQKRKADREWIKEYGLTEYTISSYDQLALRGYLLSADEPTDKYAFCVHGYRSTGLTEFDSIMRFYHEQGINVFFIDQRACGNSEGTNITYGMKERIDCMFWLNFMLNEFGNDIKILIHGVSMGSATVMMMCGSKLPENVKFAICDCGYATLKSQLLYNFGQHHMPPELSYKLYRATCKSQQKFDPDACQPVTAMESCTIPVIFAHGKADDFVPYEMVYAVYDACASDWKKLVSVDGAAHAKSFFKSNELKQEIVSAIKEFM